MHEYYRKKTSKLKKGMNGCLKLVASELEEKSGNLDYVMFGAFDVPLFREHTCFEDGD